MPTRSSHPCRAPHTRHLETSAHRPTDSWRSRTYPCRACHLGDTSTVGVWVQGLLEFEDTHALGSYRKAMPRSIEAPWGWCVSLISSNPCMSLSLSQGTATMGRATGQDEPALEWAVGPKAPMAPMPISRRARPGLWPTHSDAQARTAFGTHSALAPLPVQLFTVESKGEAVHSQANAPP